MDTFDGDIIEIDNRLLENCLLKNCTLVYRGGPVNIQPSVTMENCKLQVHHCAANTVAALHLFYSHGMRDQMLRLLEKGSLQ